MTGYAGVAVYDDGVRRSADTGNLSSTGIAFSSSASTLYGAGPQEFMPGLRTMSVSASGVSVTNTTPALPLGNGMKVENGLLYTSGGSVIEPGSKTLQGLFAGSSVVLNGFQVDSTIDRTFFLSASYPYAAINVFNRSNFTKVGTMAIAIFGFNANSLVRWGTDGLAFLTDNQLYFVRI